MRFDDDARLDTSQVQDVRGSRARGAAIGGGGLTIVGLIIALLLGVNPLESDPSALQSPSDSSITDLGERCRTGADANAQEDCRIVGFVNSVQSFWTEEFRRRGMRYRQTRTRFFTQSVDTGCGSATSDVGPFYCPLDEFIYIDLGFFEDLRRDFGAKGGPFAQAYVIAHEYGHHVQNVVGTSDKVREGTGPESDGVRLELQADCFAGLWASGAVATGFIVGLSETDIAEALDAAAAVGDDRIQEKVQGRVTPESWTHGSAAQRQKWFRVGYDTANMDQCDTFTRDL